MNNQHLNWWPKDFYLHQFTRDAFLKLEKDNVINTSYIEYLKLLPLMQRTIVKNILLWLHFSTPSISDKLIN